MLHPMFYVTNCFADSIKYELPFPLTYNMLALCISVHRRAVPSSDMVVLVEHMKLTDRLGNVRIFPVHIRKISDSNLGYNKHYFRVQSILV
jgi:hypothetical protein